MLKIHRTHLFNKGMVVNNRSSHSIDTLAEQQKTSSDILMILRQNTMHIFKMINHPDFLFDLTSQKNPQPFKNALQFIFQELNRERFR